MMGGEHAMVRPSRLSTPVILLLVALLLAVVCGCSESSQKTERQVPDPQPSADAQATADQSSNIETIERIAEELPFFAAYDFAWNRRAIGCYDEELNAQYAHCLSQLVSLDVDVEALIDLLEHDKPKVRTLAIAMLCAKEDPSVLPHIAELLDDDAPTYRTPMEISRSGMDPNPETYWGEQTVGGAAQAVMILYLEGAARGKLPAGRSGEKEVFAAYWAAHKDLPYCASWFAAKLTRAHGGGPLPIPRCLYVRDPDTGRIRPDFDTPEDYQRFRRERDEAIDRFHRQRAGAINRVRQEIDAIPNDDRIWTLLWLYGEQGSKQLVSEAELVELCNELGPEKLLLMLRNKIPSDDPDVQPRASGNRWPYQRMSLFVLQHAEQLLRPSDAETLLACEQWHRDEAAPLGTAFITPWWAIAAARLQPDDAAAILRPAFDRFDRAEERTELDRALADRRERLRESLPQWAPPDDE